MANEDRKLGIDVVGALPWGKHLCYFYNTKQDLIDILVPYFKAGLENNELCIWINAEPLSEKEAEEAIGKAIPDFPQYLASGQMEIIPHTDWYLKGGVFNTEKVLNAGIDKLKRAMASGYDGLRISGDAAWLKRKDWNKFMAYEEEANHGIGNACVLVLCTYPLHKHGTSQATNVMSNHQYNLIKHKDELVLIGGSEHERVVEAELGELQEKFSKAFNSSFDAVIISRFTDGKILEVNDVWESITGYSREEVLGKSSLALNLLTPLDRQRAVLLLEKQGFVREFELEVRRKSGDVFQASLSIEPIEINSERCMLTTMRDITERKQAERQSEERYHPVIQNLRDELLEAEGKFHKATRASSDIFCITTFDDGKFVDVNDNFFRVFGYTRDEVIGRSSNDLNLWIDTKQRETIINNLKRQGMIQNEEALLRTKSGEIRIMKYSVEYHTIEGQPCIISVMTDITGRKQAEEKEQAIISTAIDGFWTTDLEGRFIEVNDSYCQMIGYTREELLKMSIQDIEALERPEDTANHIKKIILRGSDRFKTQHRCKDGKIIDIEMNTIYNNMGKGQIFVFIHDLTALKHATESQRMLSRVKSEKHLTELQKSFVREGFKGLEDQEIIELLLSLVLPAQKAKQLSKACTERFQNLSNFLAAPPKEQQEVGITPTCMLCIKLLHELPAKVLKQRIVARSIYKSSKEVFDYLYYSMRDLKKEVFKVIYLDNRSQIIDTADLFEGTADNIPIRPREIVESTLTQGATALIFVHNHPTGDPTPSRSDKQLTRDLVFVGNILQIKVLDHIIIGADSYFSFTDDGLTQKYQDNFMNLKIRGVLTSRPLYHIYRHLPKELHHQHLTKLFNECQLIFPD